jgi:hypothetical protein
MIILHVPQSQIAAYYEIGWTINGESSSYGYVVISWNNSRAPVVPYHFVEETFAHLERGRVRMLQLISAANAAASIHSANMN